VANTLNLFRGGAVGFIDWLDLLRACLILIREEMNNEREKDSGSEKIHPTSPRVWLQDTELEIAAEPERPSDAETDYPDRRMKAADKAVNQDR
jgi:hypothetical protein